MCWAEFPACFIQVIYRIQKMRLLIHLQVILAISNQRQMKQPKNQKVYLNDMKSICINFATRTTERTNVPVNVNSLKVPYKNTANFRKNYIGWKENHKRFIASLDIWYSSFGVCQIQIPIKRISNFQGKALQNYRQRAAERNTDQCTLHHSRNKNTCCQA